MKSITDLRNELVQTTNTLRELGVVKLAYAESRIPTMNRALVNSCLRWARETAQNINAKLEA